CGSVMRTMLPRLGGVELARELERARPGISVLYMSGYAADEVLRDQIADQHRPFLEKPFTPLQLVQKVGAVLS
ncbi:MAG TPA: hypothetical protein VK864_05540, partial [Longimicrobiales bacterium]|nr:hypothetical protein [Longimicrobiales bacterium]